MVIIRAGLASAVVLFSGLLVTGMPFTKTLLISVVVAVLTVVLRSLVYAIGLPDQGRRPSRPTLLERARERYAEGGIALEDFEQVVEALLEEGIADEPVTRELIATPQLKKYLLPSQELHAVRQGFIEPSAELARLLGESIRR